MIKLTKPLNLAGDIILAGTMLNLGDREKQLIESGSAEGVEPKLIINTEEKKEDEAPVFKKLAKVKGK